MKEKCESGELDNMNEHQLMVYMQKINRAITNQRDVPFNQRLEQLVAMSKYLQSRIEQDESPIYLQEIADYVKLNPNRTVHETSKLR